MLPLGRLHPLHTEAASLPWWSSCCADGWCAGWVHSVDGLYAGSPAWRRAGTSCPGTGRRADSGWTGSGSSDSAGHQANIRNGKLIIHSVTPSWLRQAKTNKEHVFSSEPRPCLLPLSVQHGLDTSICQRVKRWAEGPDSPCGTEGDNSHTGSVEPTCNSCERKYKETRTRHETSQVCVYIFVCTVIWQY